MNIEIVQSYDELDIARLVAENNRAVLQAVYYKIYRHKNRPDLQLAEDITQDAFIKIVLGMRKGQYRDQEGVDIRAWMRRVGVNTLNTYYRDNNTMLSTMEEHELNPEDHMYARTCELFDEYFDEGTLPKGRIKQARGAVRKLAFDQRETIILRVFFKCSFKEIADRTDTSINTALGRMRKSLINLRKHMDLIDEGNYEELQRLERIAKGRKKGASKLSPTQIAEIRSLINEGKPREEIATLYGTTKANLDFIRRGDTFKQKTA